MNDYRSMFPFDDLVHAGVLGLIDALQKYDCRKEVQFKSYAKHRIRGAILDSLREMDWSPRDLRRKARMLDEVHQRLGTELGRAATEQEIAEDLHLSLEELHRLLNELGGLDLGSLQQESFEDGKETDLAESLPANPDDNPFQACLDGEMKALARAGDLRITGEGASGAGPLLLRRAHNEGGGGRAGRG